VSATVRPLRPTVVTLPPVCDLPAPLPRFSQWVEDEMRHRPAHADLAKRDRLAASMDTRWWDMPVGWPADSGLVKLDIGGTSRSEDTWPTLPVGARQELAWALGAVCAAGGVVSRMVFNGAIAAVSWAGRQYGLSSLVDLTPLQWAHAPARGLDQSRAAAFGDDREDQPDPGRAVPGPAAAHGVAALRHRPLVAGRDLGRRNGCPYSAPAA
jgi:hypothetical protein